MMTVFFATRMANGMHLYANWASAAQNSQNSSEGITGQGPSWVFLVVKVQPAWPSIKPFPSMTCNLWLLRSLMPQNWEHWTKPPETWDPKLPPCWWWIVSPRNKKNLSSRVNSWCSPWGTMRFGRFGGNDDWVGRFMAGWRFTLLLCRKRSLTDLLGSPKSEVHWCERLSCKVWLVLFLPCVSLCNCHECDVAGSRASTVFRIFRCCCCFKTLTLRRGRAGNSFWCKRF